MRATIVLLLLAARAAHATCGTPAPRFGPESGSAVPADPTLYLFAPTRSHPTTIRVEGDGRRLSYTTALLSDTGAYTATAVHIETAGVHVLRVFAETDYPESTEAHYVIDRWWRRPPRRPVELSGFVHSQFRWPCDHQDAVQVFPSVDAAAYRMVWTGPGGETGQVTLPPGPVVDLGYMSCLGATIPDDLPERYLYGLEALHADGSADPPARLVPSDLRALGPPEDEPFARPEIWHDAPQTASPPRPRPPPHFLWAIFGGGLAGTLVGYAIGRTRCPRGAAPS